jgi:hypothetical protein
LSIKEQETHLILQEYDDAAIDDEINVSSFFWRTSETTITKEYSVCRPRFGLDIDRKQYGNMTA